MNKQAYEHIMGITLRERERALSKRADDNAYVFNSLIDLNPVRLYDTNTDQNIDVLKILQNIRSNPDKLRHAVILDKSLGSHGPVWRDLQGADTLSDFNNRLKRSALGRRILFRDDMYHKLVEHLHVPVDHNYNVRGARALDRILGDKTLVREMQGLQEDLEDLRKETAPGFLNKLKNAGPSYAGLGVMGGVGGYFLAPKGWETTGAITGTTLGLVANWLRRKHKYGDFVTV